MVESFVAGPNPNMLPSSGYNDEVYENMEHLNAC